ncbi:unnamed protein product [Rhizoctonia solani]|uniref:Uncharacterized protein n=1 Tax=Rhizoctonia solani TaxID=456999 RepID=A0A8H3DBZ9_9AGAM|nr:unnamed protein product [Rhizoctonia solani]
MVIYSQLTNLGYPGTSMRVATDVLSQPVSSYKYLMECIDWLVQDASEGTQLFFVLTSTLRSEESILGFHFCRALADVCSNPIIMRRDVWREPDQSDLSPKYLLIQDASEGTELFSLVISIYPRAMELSGAMSNWS